MSGFAALPRRARFRAVTYMSTRPRLYYGVRRLSGRTDPLCIRPDTNIVIEGFPRSANSTTVYGFLARQDEPLHVAHHKHHAAQILRAAEWGIPAVALIRAPRAACLSLLALAAEARHRNGRKPMSDLSFVDAFGAYVVFYEAVEQRLEYAVIGRFESIRGDLSCLINRVNARFGTSFRSEASASDPQPKLGWHAMPNEIRDGIKRDLDSQFDAEFAASPTLRRLVARAEDVHARFEEADDRAR